MYAIVISGGKQYKVAENDVLNVEKLEANIGDKINLDTCLLVDGEKVLAAKDLEGVVVEAEVLNHGKDKKITVFRYKPKKNVRRKLGHRQPFTTLKIVSIKKA